VAYRIIVADPSPSVQKAVQLAFPEPEFRLFPFEDGADLLESIAGVRPDAVLLSLSLPGRDAFEVGRLLRSREELRRVPLVFLRGTFEVLDASRLAAADYDGIFQKPFDSERLAASVRELIEKRTWPSTLPEEPVIPEERPAGSDGGTTGAA
jgi:DNA-binding response OmpR family regulator